LIHFKLDAPGLFYSNHIVGPRFEGEEYDQTMLKYRQEIEQIENQWMHCHKHCLVPIVGKCYFECNAQRRKSKEKVHQTFAMYLDKIPTTCSLNPNEPSHFPKLRDKYKEIYSQCIGLRMFRNAPYENRFQRCRDQRDHDLAALH
jgi:hypothetical protein